MNSDDLNHIAVLQGLDSDALTRLAAVLEEKEYVDGQVVFAEGVPGDSMYFLTEGCIRIEKSAHVDGAVQKTLAVLEAGDYFGEMALLDDKPRAAAAVSSGKTRVLRLSKASFDQIHYTWSPAAMNLLFGMIRTSSERIRWLSTQLIAYDEVGKAIGDGRDLQSLLKLIVDQLSTATGADWSFLVLRSEFSGRLDLRAQVNLALSPAQLEAVSNGEGFLDPVLRNPQDLLAPSFKDYELFKSCARLGFETETLLVAPIILSEQLLGLIALGGNKKNQFGLNTLNLARGIARQTAQAILDGRHREEDEARFQRSRQSARS